MPFLLPNQECRSTEGLSNARNGANTKTKQKSEAKLQTDAAAADSARFL